MTEIPQELIDEIGTGLQNLGNLIIDETSVGFVIIGSPMTFMEPDGNIFPVAVSISVNPDIQFTRSSIGAILERLGSGLSQTVDDEITTLMSSDTNE